jgi:hypothetical protein
VTGDQVCDQSRGHERARRGPDGLADRCSTRGLLPGGLREGRSGVRERNAEKASNSNPGTPHVLISSGRLNLLPVG